MSIGVVQKASLSISGARETGNLLFLRLPGGEGNHIDSAFVIQGRGMILNNHDTSADAGEQAAASLPTLPKPCSATLAPSISIPARRALPGR